MEERSTHLPESEPARWVSGPVQSDRWEIPGGDLPSDQRRQVDRLAQPHLDRDIVVARSQVSLSPVELNMAAGISPLEAISAQIAGSGHKGDFEHVVTAIVDEGIIGNDRLRGIPGAAGPDTVFDGVTPDPQVGKVREVDAILLIFNDGIILDIGQGKLAGVETVTRRVTRLRRLPKIRRIL